MKPLSPQSKKKLNEFQVLYLCSKKGRSTGSSMPTIISLLPLQAGKEKHLFCYFYSCNGLRNWMELIVGDWHNITDKSFLTILPWKKETKKAVQLQSPHKNMKFAQNIKEWHVIVYINQLMSNKTRTRQNGSTLT